MSIKKSTLLILPLLLLLGALFLTMKNKSDTLLILPEDSGLASWPWAETAGNDSSRVVSFLHTGEGLKLQYTLNHKAPYAGVTINPSHKPHWDVSEYDYLELCINPENTTGMQITLSYFLTGFSKLDKWQTLRITDIMYRTTDQKRIRIPFKNLTTPIWWYRENNVQPDSVPEIDYAQLANISFVNPEGAPMDSTLSMEIQSITFGKEQKSYAVLFWGALGTYLLGLGVWFGLQRKKRPLNHLKQLEVSNYADEEYERLSRYLGENFTIKKLTQTYVAEQTGLASTKITNLLRKFRNESFNQHLNTLRLTEAKRLLRETDRNVSEIASLVGYGYVNSFNRVFKETEKTTPVEYRTTHKN